MSRSVSSGWRQRESERGRTEGSAARSRPTRSVSRPARHLAARYMSPLRSSSPAKERQIEVGDESSGRREETHPARLRGRGVSARYVVVAHAGEIGRGRTRHGLPRAPVELVRPLLKLLPHVLRVAPSRSAVDREHRVRRCCWHVGRSRRSEVREASRAGARERRRAREKKTTRGARTTDRGRSSVPSAAAGPSVDDDRRQRRQGDAESRRATRAGRRRTGLRRRRR